MKYLHQHFSDYFVKKVVQSNMYKTTTLGNTQKWSSWAGGHLKKHLYKMATKHMYLFFAGF